MKKITKMKNRSKSSTNNPVSVPTLDIPFQDNPSYFLEDKKQPPYYANSTCNRVVENNMTFSTFFSPNSFFNRQKGGAGRRRHSFASSSLNNSNSFDGYLKPKAPQPPKVVLEVDESETHFYVNEQSPRSNHSDQTSSFSFLPPIPQPSPTSLLLNYTCNKERAQSPPPYESQICFVEVYTPISTSSNNDIDDDDDTVFTTNENSNESTASTITAIANNSFFSSNSPKLLNDKNIPLSVRKESFCEPFCSLCATNSSNISKCGSPAVSNDVAIIKSTDCFFSKNAERLIQKFLENVVSNEKKKLNISHQSFDVRDLDKMSVAVQIHCSRVQIVIISQHFLDRLKYEGQTRKKLSPINRVLRSNRTLAVLVNVSQNHIIDSYQAVLARFEQWTFVELESTSKMDLDFFTKFSKKFLNIYNLENLKEKESTSSTSSNNSANVANTFSLFPKKVSKEQPKVLILLKSPVEDDEKIEVYLKRGKITEQAGYTLLNPYSIFIRIPELLFAEICSLVEVSVFLSSRLIGLKFLKLDNKFNNPENEIFEEEIGPGYTDLESSSRSSSSRQGSRSDSELSSEVSALSVSSGTSSQDNSLNNSYQNDSFLNYDFPRFQDQDYKIPPSIARPVVPKKPIRKSSITTV